MHGRTGMLARSTLAALLCTAPVAGAATITGSVRDTSGAAVAGATIRLWEAGPLEGVGTLCPSCYPDCGKLARTGRDGRFSLAGLDDALRFRLLVVAKGFRPAFVERVVPAAGPVEARLAPRTLASVPDSEVVRGVVLDEAGRPVSAALLAPFGYRMGRLSSFGPSAQDPLVVSDEAGRFDFVVGAPKHATMPAGFATLFASVPDSAIVWYVKVEARGFAGRVVQDMAPGAARQRVVLSHGAAASGRVVRDGRPLAGVEIEACQEDRGARTFAGRKLVATDSTGRFFFEGLLPVTRYVLYGRMQSFVGHGGAPLLRFATPPDDSTRDFGVVPPTVARTLAGRLTLEDGSAMPAGTRVTLSRPGTGDAVELPTDSDGRFAFAALPPESLDVEVRVRNRHLDPATPGFLPRSQSGVRIAEAGDVRLELRLLPGEPEWPAGPARRPAAGDSAAAGGPKR